MKKYILSFMALCFCGLAYSESFLTVAPLKLTADQAKNGQTGTLSVKFQNDECPDFTVGGARFYLPAGMKTNGNATNAGTFDFSTKTCVSKTNKQSTAYPTYGLLTLISDNALNCEGEEIVTIPYTFTADLAEGVYPIYVTDIKLANEDNSINYTAPECVSYLIVGEGGELKFESLKKTSTVTISNWALSSDATAALAEASNVNKLDLSAVTAINGDFAAVDGREIVAPTAGVTVSKLTYDLTGATETAMKTIVFPYEVTVPAGVAYTTTGAIVGGYVHFDEATTIPANTPAIVTGDVNISLDNVTLVDATPLDVTAGEYYLAGSKFKKAASDFTAPVYRAKWALTGGEVKGFVLNSADGIKTVELNDVEGAEIFDLGGRKLNKATKGVNIIGGQKVLRK